MTMLTDKQKKLFQEDKYVLVDTIIILEEKLNKCVEDIKFQQNEMLLSVVGLKSELEEERQARCNAEQAHITAQEEIDGKKDPIDRDAFLHQLQDKTDHICKLVDLEWNGQITLEELKKRLHNIVLEDK